MKKNCIFVWAALASMAVLASCAKENGTVTPEIVPDGEIITITASFPADGLTKVDFEEYDYNDRLDLTWSADDVITITDATNPSNKQTYTLVDGAGEASATFSGPAVTGASSYIISYEGAANFDYANQTQAADGDPSNLKYFATISGVNSYENFTFSKAWADENGGTFTCSSALRLRANIPSDLVGTVQAVRFRAGAYDMTVTLEDPSDGGELDILTIYATLPAGDIAIPAGTPLLINFQTGDNDYEKYTAYRVLGAMNILSGKVNSIGLNCENILSFANASAERIGTASNPYLIGDQNQMDAMHSELASGAIKYFAMVDDVDMTGVEWVSLNYASPYDLGVNFDGRNHTISNLTCNSGGYPSFAGVAYGTYKDFVIEGAEIEGGDNNAGVFAGYIGSGDYTGTCSGITVKDSQITGEVTGTKGRNIGGFAGVLGASGSSITDCHVTGTTTVRHFETAVTGSSAAGFIANITVPDVTISGCTSKADVDNASSYYTGGFIGQVTATGNFAISDCAYLGGELTAGRVANANSPVGGFVGRVAGSVAATFSKCYVDGAKITAPEGGRIGGFVGDTGNNVGTKCTSCYVVNTTLSGAQHVGGFAGVLYTAASKCYVESTSIKANNSNNGGFAGYLERASAIVDNCYATVTIDGGTCANVGGFIGNCRGSSAVTNSYANGTISGTGADTGAFIGTVAGAIPTSVTNNIAWNYGSLTFVGGGLDASSVITGNYIGNSGTISSQATALGWDSSIWDLSGSTPKLK